MAHLTISSSMTETTDTSSLQSSALSCLVEILKAPAKYTSPGTDVTRAREIDTIIAIRFEASKHLTLGKIINAFI